MTLTIQDLGALGEFFGSIAVLATLIYLGAPDATEHNGDRGAARCAATISQTQNIAGFR